MSISNRRLKRAKRSRVKMAELNATRLTIYRSNSNIYAQIIAIGKRIAEKAVKAGVKKIAFDRSGYKYHGRIKALAESARENGLTF